MQVFLALALLAGLAFSANATNPPKWDPNYIVKGTLYIPYAEIAEPFYAWYDKNTRRSRIDYYGGMVKTYQLAGEGQYGTLLKLAPITTKTENNKLTCLQVNGTADQAVDIQSILPDAKPFSLVGTESFLGYTCDKFRLESTIGQKKNIYTLWVRYKKSPHYPSSRMPIPVRYEMRGYNTLLGSHYDHYYLDYDSYEHDDIPNEVFEIDDSLQCVGFPGPGTGHYATFNPMQEFISGTDEHVDKAFHHFKRKHGVAYHSDTEHEHRKNIFRQNLRYIHSKNRAKLTYTLAVNHLADKTEEELKARRGYKSSGIYNTGKPFPYDVPKYKDEIPDQYDWRLYGAVTPVKDQSVCGSCWSFGTIGHLEGAFFLKNGGNLVRLSQQALIDCSWAYGNNGCDGGEDFRVYQWMLQSGGVPTEEEYGPYLGQDGYCHVNNVTLVAPIKGFVNVTSNDPNAFKLALLKHGPLSVAIDASPKTFSFYSHGVYYEPTCKNDVDGLDHAVLAVGYGSINGEDYWLVKNSWSTYWGNDGYILMSAKKNNCGVMTMPTYVEM
uniref:26-29kD-proteinase n=1 Tax=Drosophila melanogaster TaxID=7227 RepID=Q9V3U6_DROME|nr:cathepsin K1 [Drosophila melanogaster]AAF49777.1 cathepsin K1 [Drosophila melanogaster]AAM52734.1 RE18380p [Drosophila melanogaster]BAA86910.1 homologue of Sarcophaga 26,29kDa proteinase [Drosophila melanogaster]|eukprot:NP_620470.1 26-29kD-proteinase [Drosophila melanogaster]